VPGGRSSTGRLRRRSSAGFANSDSTGDYAARAGTAPAAYRAGGATTIAALPLDFASTRTAIPSRRDAVRGGDLRVPNRRVPITCRAARAGRS
jgi:hypothetical protein